MIGLTVPCVRSQAVTTAEFSLGTPVRMGDVIETPVSLLFTPMDLPSPSGVVFVQLDVSASSAELTGGGADFSRFSFRPSALFNDWDQAAPVVDAAPPPALVTLGADSVFTYEFIDTDIAPGSALSPGADHVLGTLIVDVSALGAGSYEVDLGGPDTDAGYEAPLGDFQANDFIFAFVSQTPDGQLITDMQTFRLDDGTGGGDVIPEPGTAVLMLLSAASLGLHRRRRSREATERPGNASAVQR